MAGSIEVETNANLVAADLMAVGFKSGTKAFGITKTFGEVLLSNVKKRASRPRVGTPDAARDEQGRFISREARAARAAEIAAGTGPRLQTGAYVRSMTMSMSIFGGGPTASVGSNAPQARRLEHGFRGTDSLGRRYNQGPLPHWGPALDEVGPAFVAALMAVVDE